MCNIKAPTNMSTMKAVIFVEDILKVMLFLLIR